MLGIKAFFHFLWENFFLFCLPRGKERGEGGISNVIICAWNNSRKYDFKVRVPGGASDGIEWGGGGKKQLNYEKGVNAATVLCCAVA